MFLHIFSLPLANPVLIFAVILFIILLAPIVLHRFKIPDLIGLIIAGAVIGPYGLGIMTRDSSMELFGTVGLLYIMFIAGLEIDMADLRKNYGKTLAFGLYTFLIPMILGTLTSVYWLNFSWPTSILLASMYASHTLITYPIVSKYGITKNRAVSIAIGGTVITCFLALLVLAVVVGMSTGEINQHFWLKLGISSIVFIALIVVLFPMLGRWFFKHYEDSVGQYIFVLALVFLASFLAEAAGLEAIIGAFLAGLALNRLIPNTSALMNRIDFVGNAIFIPFFLIGVGMLVNIRTFTSGWTALWVAVVMTIIATLSKFIAAWITEKSFRLTRDEGGLLFGLSNAQAAATLAAVMIGYKVILGTDEIGNPIRLLNEDVLNGTIVMILITCMIASLVTQRSAQNIAISEMSGDRIGDNDDEQERILIPLSNSETVEELITLGTAIKSRRNKAKLVVVSIVKSDNIDATVEKEAKLLLEKAKKVAAATELYIEPVLRYDLNIVNGIRNVAKEHKITDIVIGLRTQKDISDTFLGKLTEEVLSKCSTTTLAYRPMQPMSTVKRYIVVIPENAEKEIGFPYWLISVWNLGKNIGTKLVFYGNPNILNILKLVHSRHFIDAEFKEFTDWDNFTEVAREMQDNDALMLVMSRRNCPSYSRHMEYVPTYINKYFNTKNCILIFPIQLGIGEDISTFRSISMIDHIEGMDGLVQVLAKLFKKNK
ncbi:MAG: cation:proton antiporter [Odoribacter sp.]